VHNSIWVIGGSDSNDVFGDVAVLDLKTLQWSCPQL
jgi:hypothetical protein